MKAAEKEHKKLKKESTTKISSTKNIIEEKLPDWFDQKIEKNKIDEEKEQSLKDMLKEFS